MYSEEGFVVAVPERTRFILSVFEAPLPSGKGLRACLSSFRWPSPDMPPTDAKTACLYSEGNHPPAHHAAFAR